MSQVVSFRIDNNLYRKLEELSEGKVGSFSKQALEKALTDTSNNSKQQQKRESQQTRNGYCKQCIQSLNYLTEKIESLETEILELKSPYLS